MLEKIMKFKDLIDKSDKLLLINHIKMDPDAFWSLATFYHIMEKIWKEVKAVNDMNPPEDFDFLKSSEIIDINLDIKEYNPDLIISFDAASLWQLWETYIKNEEIFSSKDFVVIDHHMTNPGFWSLNLIDIKRSSTCELLFHILETIDFSKYITDLDATLLTSWIHTDTNVFYNQNTSSETLRIAAKLMDLWADFRAPMFNFFQKASFNKTQLAWEIYANLNKTDDWKVIWWKVTDETFKKTWTWVLDTDWIINRIINIEWCEVAFILFQLWENSKASFRSKEYSVWDLCASFPLWGWHKLAAWLRSEKNVDILEKEILDKLKKDFI